MRGGHRARRRPEGPRCSPLGTLQGSRGANCETCKHPKMKTSKRGRFPALKARDPQPDTSSLGWGAGQERLGVLGGSGGRVRPSGRSFHTDHLELKLLFSLLSPATRLQGKRQSRISFLPRRGQATRATKEILHSLGFQEATSCIKIASQAMKDASGQPSLSSTGSWPVTPISTLA